MTSRLSLIAAGLFLFFYSSWVYVNFTQRLFAYANFSYNAGTANSFLLVAIASIALLLALVDRQLKPAHLFLFVVFVFVLNGILVTGIYFITLEQATSAVALVLLGSVIMVPLSNTTLTTRIRGSTRFELVVFVLFVAVAAIIGVEAMRHGVRLVSFSQIYALRGEVDLSGPGRYALSLYMFAIGPAAMAIGLWRRNYLFAAAAMGLFVVLYMLTFQKAVLLAPAWVVAMWCFTGFRMARTPVGIFCFLIAPLVLSGLYVSLDLPGSREILGTIPMRMYAVPGQVFAHYVDFFSRNPHTWFSHVTGLNLFIDYPYTQQLPLLIGDAYPGGNQNANFWAQDAIAGAGLWAIPLVSLAFGLVLVLVNSAASGLDIRFVLTMCTMAAQRFSDGGLATGVLTGGLGLLLILLVLAPRNVYGYDRKRAAAPQDPGLRFA